MNFFVTKFFFGEYNMFYIYKMNDIIYSYIHNPTPNISI